MEQSILINSSVCLTDLVNHAKAGHSAFSKGKNGKVYVNLTEWINAEPNQYGQHSSILLNSRKEKKDEEGKVYVGNGRKSEFTPEPVGNNDLPDAAELGGYVSQGPAIADLPDNVDKLPF
jgi:hypothetical protein